MEKQTYNEQTIIQYLLGSLPEEETERFDELSFIDDEFAEQLQAAEDDLAAAYVNGELSGQTLERFNSYYLASPKRRDNVRFAQALQVFTDQAVAAKPAKEASESITSRFEPNKPATRRRSSGFFTVPSLATQWGFAAAAILLLLAGAWLVFETLRLRNQANQAQVERVALQRHEKVLQAQLEREHSAGSETKRELERARERLARLEQQALEQKRAKLQPPSLPAELNIAHFDLAPQMRSRSTMITIPPGTDYVTLQLELDANDYPAYRTELHTQTGNVKVWSSGEIKAKTKGEKKVLDIGIRADKLKMRGYILMLKGIAQDGSEQDAPSYAFRVVKQ